LRPTTTAFPSARSTTYHPFRHSSNGQCTEL